jgi:hypothetical protein
MQYWRRRILNLHDLECPKERGQIANRVPVRRCAQSCRHSIHLPAPTLGNEREYLNLSFASITTQLHPRISGEPYFFGSAFMSVGMQAVSSVDRPRFPARVRSWQPSLAVESRRALSPETQRLFTLNYKCRMPRVPQFFRYVCCSINFRICGAGIAPA